MDAREETVYILRNIWLKLHNLPNASTIELGAFLVILTFILLVLLMTALTCVNYCCCCCCRKTKKKGSNI